jgi:bacillithiol synthase
VTPDIHTGSIGGGALVERYLTGDPDILRFFQASPFEAESFRAKAADLRRRFHARGLSAMTEAVNPLGDAAADRLAAVARGEGFMITTGQQPGLFGGPLYSVYKALTAVAVARRIETLLAVPVLALFWVASDDHDWEEANHVHVLDTGNELRRLQLEGSAEPGRSMGRRRLEQGAETALADLAEALPPSDFAPSVLERLRNLYRPENTVAGAFAGLLADLFQGLPLGLVDSQDPVVRELAHPVIERELDRAAEHEAALARRTAELEAEGLGAQVLVPPGSSNVFLEEEPRGRERLLRHDGHWVLRGSGRRLTDAQVRERVANAPASLSPNVLLRPVVESFIFPTLA